ncbi:hypothetical protein [Mesorhizobium sp. LjNodule214]|uniref:hypothetical protein n=1 Tax=Mesorhizobium sp. LjNodule214 TaxID=3342252 RepID=UPI003ECE9997
MRFVLRALGSLEHPHREIAEALIREGRDQTDWKDLATICAIAFARGVALMNGGYRTFCSE